YLTYDTQWQRPFAIKVLRPELASDPLAEEFDRDPFAMLAWRGKARDDLLAALREVRSVPRSPAGGPGPAGVLEPAERTAPLPDAPGEFWSARLSPARLRALSAPGGPSAPDLLLRMFPPPPVPVRGQDLAEVLTPAYHRLATDIS
ncbi:MAG: hypothetical protein ACRDPD_00170, partial [Streptosporangiaceae bacterium]